MPDGLPVELLAQLPDGGAAMSTHDETLHDVEVRQFIIELRLDMLEADLDRLADEVARLRRPSWWRRLIGGAR